jgi:hypothetical protein
VREAVAAELERAGLTGAGVTASNLTLSCDILDLKAVITPGFFKGIMLDLVVVVRFEWRYVNTKNVLATNERSERRSRKARYVPSLPMDGGIVQDWGKELINDMLPRVIEKEINSVPFLQPQGK